MPNDPAFSPPTGPLSLAATSRPDAAPLSLDLSSPPPTRAPGAASQTRAHEFAPGEDPDVFARNIAAIAQRSPRAARRIAAAPPKEKLDIFESAQPGVLTAELDGRLLASRRRPADEADKLARSVDLESTGGIVVLGFGMGHHLAAFARHAERLAAIVCFEPDESLLRSVLARVDHADWLASAHFVLATDPDDPAGLTASLNGLEGPLSVGVDIVPHPPSANRLGDSGKRFAATFADVFGRMRTQIVTTLVQTDVTVRNEFMNADQYLRWPGVADLRGVLDGRPAVCVAAGPSLRRNIHQLAKPGVRERVCIIAVQTALKPLLAAGVKPHFVTAIDYHEISTRFYEGLTPDDVEGVTLVAQARANPAILDAFPGAVRIPQDDQLAEILDIQHHVTRDRGSLPLAATVAHMSYYLARFLGADPVLLVGQDLAFTDHQYYGEGAAIHNVWAAELSSVRTLEMLEWERIARMRGTIHPATDLAGRNVYTDEQMATYRAQFERDFLKDADAGRTVIDATEGGVAKRHTEHMPLAEALERFAPTDQRSLPDLTVAEPRPDDDFADELRERLSQLRRGVRSIVDASDDALELLRKMLRDQRDQQRINKLVDELNTVRDRVHQTGSAYRLLSHTNQFGAMGRMRRDRLITIAQRAGDAMAAQRQQIERDRENVRWHRAFAELLDHVLGVALDATRGGDKLLRDVVPPALADAPDDAPARITGSDQTLRTAALLHIQPDAEPADNLRPTLARLARCQTIGRALVVSNDPARAERLAGGSLPGLDVEFAREDRTNPRRAQSVRAARRWAGHAWRGGLGGMTVWDEVFDPQTVHRALDTHDLDAALVLGPHWRLVDPDLCDQLVRRHTAGPEAAPLVFTPAAPGLAGAVIGKSLAADLAHAGDDAALYASIAGALGYVPVRPRLDPLASVGCVQAPPHVRDLAVRLIPDTPASADLLRRLGRRLDAHASADNIARALRHIEAHSTPPAPSEIILSLTTDTPFLRPLPGAAPTDHADPIAPDTARDALDALLAAFPGAAVSFAGPGDALTRPDTPDLVARARSRGAAGVHVRTTLLSDQGRARACLDAGAEILTVDLLANTAAAYHALSGVDRFRDALTALDALLAGRSIDGGMPSPWIVPRLTRCDAVYDDIESFYDKWCLLAGAAIIDPPERTVQGERTAPLTPPPRARAVERRRTLRVGPQHRSDASIRTVLTTDLADLWSRTVSADATGARP